MPEQNLEQIVSAEQLVDRLNEARKQARTFPAGHSNVVEAAAELKEAADALLGEMPAFTLSFSDKEVHFEGSLLTRSSLRHERLVRELLERDIASITFYRGLAFEELARFVTLLNVRPGAAGKWDGWVRVLEEESIEHVAVDRLVALPESTRGKGAEVPREVYRAALEAVVNAFMDAHRHRPFNMENIQHVVRLLVASVIEDEQMILGLSTLKSADEYTFYHSVNVAILALLLGSRLKLRQEVLHKLGVAAILHDIGKVHVPEGIINKPESLSPEEWAIMQGHPLEGVRILSEQRNMNPLALVVAAQHHVSHDLQGYPTLKGVARPHQVSSLVAVVDVYDALTSDRSYRRAMTPDRAMQLILTGRGTTFDPGIAKVFANLAGVFPVGTLVELDSGDWGVVASANPADLIRPRVRLVAASGAPSHRTATVDLSERVGDGSYARSITRTLDPRVCNVDVSQYL